MHRRRFLKIAALTPMAFHLGQGRAAICSERQDERVIYAGTREAIHIFAWRRGKWSLLQEIDCEAPSCLALHPVEPVLYATNETREFQGLPAGSVSVFRVEADGHLRQIQRVKLSLSATLPRSVAISPDGTCALVTAHGGGSYNLFSIHRDGSLGHLRGVVKESGCGLYPEHQESSHPQHACFDGTDRILAADRGTDRIHVLSVTAGTLRLEARHQLAPGAGPSHIAVHPAGPFIACLNGLSGSVSVHRYDSSHGTLGEQVVALQGRAMALHPQRLMLIVDSGKSLNLYRWHGDTGQLHLLHSIDVHSTVTAMHAGQRSILFASEGEVTCLSWDDLRVQPLPLRHSIHCLLSA